MSGITWLHLSDWHQRGRDFDRRVVRDALMRDIRERRKISPGLEQVDFVFVTGDIAFSGKPEEYEAAVEHFFRPLMEAVGPGDAGWERLYVVPGNHDVDRAAIQRLSSELKVTLDGPKAVNELLEVGWKRQAVLSALSGYGGFVSKYLGERVKGWKGEPTYSYLSRVEVGGGEGRPGKRVVIIGLNTAWYTARNTGADGDAQDYGYLLMGEPQVYDRLNELENDDLVISLMHHPVNWLADFDRDVTDERLTRRCHFILHGHQHQPRVYFTRSTLGDVVVIPGGACYDRRRADDPRYTNAYNFVRLDFDTGQGTVYLRKWSDGRDEWVADEDLYRDGSFQFTLPKSEELQPPAKKWARQKLVERYKPFFSLRFCNEIELRMSQKLEAVDGVSLVRHSVYYRRSMPEGEPDSILHETFGSDRVIDLVKRSVVSAKPYEAHYFRINGRDVTPAEVSDEKIVFRASLDEKAAVVEYYYTIYLMPEDVYLMRLGRFTHKFKFRFQRDNALKYDFNSIGGLPLPAPKRDAVFGQDEAESTDLCFPDQGYLIHWYPEQP